MEHLENMCLKVIVYIQDNSIIYRPDNRKVNKMLNHLTK
jgi:hypothetical protein